MEKKIIAIMIALVVVAMLVVVGLTLGVSVSSGRSGDFTGLFDKLTNSDVNVTYGQHLNLPSNWKEGDKKTVKDTIVDMWYSRTTVGQTHVYTTHLLFTYLGDRWNDAHSGTLFFVPEDGGYPWLVIAHGMFEIDVSSATNLTAKYHIGDPITLTTMLSVNSLALLSFGEWQVANTL